MTSLYQSAAIALSALANAMYETNKVAIVRKVYSAAAGPRLGCLIPHIKAEYEASYLPLMGIINYMVLVWFYDV